MPYIKVISPAQATGRLAKIYDRVTGPGGQVDNVLQIHSLRPHTLEGHMALYKAVLHHPRNKLPHWFLEAIGVADVSLSMYQTPVLAWGANAFGGLIFGFGMVFSGGCISRNLVRAGSGDLRSIVVLLITGIFGYVAKSVIANRVYVRKDFCEIQRTWLKETLERIEKKLDTLNGGKKE
jgi:uncharacterized membrane protein YedE/YeeE